MTNPMHYQHGYKAVTLDQQAISDRITSTLQASGITVDGIEFGDLVIVRVSCADLSIIEASTRAFAAFSYGSLLMRSFGYRAEDKDHYCINLEVRQKQMSLFGEVQYV